MLGLASSLVKGGASLLTYVKDNLKLYLDFKSSRSDTLAFPSEGSTSFDGVDDRIDCGQIDVSGQNITFSAWIYRDGTTDDTVVGRWNSNGAMLYAGGANIMLYINGNNSFTSTPDKTWFHIAGTFDGVNRKIYKNGVLEDTDADTSTIVNPSENFEIGNAEFSSNKEFKGKLANVALWSRALSLEEIQSVMNKSYSQLGSVEKTSLVSWWALDNTELGTNLVSNGDFSNGATGWTDIGTGWDLTGGNATSDNSQSGSSKIRQSVSLVQNKIYRVTYDWSYSSVGSVYLYLGSQSSGWHGTTGSSLTVDILYTGSTGATTFDIYTGADSNATIDNISLQEVYTPDSKGSNNGTVTGATTTTSVYGGNAPILPRAIDIAESQAEQIGDGSASFDGSNSFIDIADNSVLDADSSDMTITFWYNPISMSANMEIIDKYDTSSNKGYRIRHHHVSSKIFFQINDGDDSDGYYSYINQALSYGEWHHVAIAWDNSANAPIYYINGIVQGVSNPQANTIGNVANSKLLRFGGTQANGSDYKGNLSQVGIWKGLLSQEKIQSLMESTSYAKIPADVKSNLGSELVTNGTFDSNINDWSAYASSRGTASWSNGRLKIDNTTGSGNYYMRQYQDFYTGKVYKLSVDVFAIQGTETSLKFIFHNNQVHVFILSEYKIGNTYTAYLTPTADVSYFLIGGNLLGDIYEFDNISVKEVTNDLVAYYPLDADSSNTSNGVGITNDSVNGETLGDDIASSLTWVNSSSSPYETFVTSGNSITNAVNTSWGIAYTSDFSLTSAKLYKISFDMDISSGSIEYVRVARSTGMETPTGLDEAPKSGTNTFYFIAVSSDSDFKFGFRGNGAVTFSLSNLSIKEVTSNTGVLK